MEYKRTTREKEYTESWLFGKCNFVYGQKNMPEV